MYALLALLLSLCHSPVPCGLSSRGTSLFFNSLHFPFSTPPERSLALCPLLCCPSLTPLSLLPKELLKCHHTDPGVCGTVRRQTRNAMAALQLKTERVGSGELC